MFINFSNHKVEAWTNEQIEAAKKYSEEICNMPFPNVPAEATYEQVKQMANEAADEIIALNPSAVLCQGEMTLCFMVVEKLKKSGILVLAATSNRDVIETVDEKTGETKKTTVFKFCQFRMY